MRFIDVTRYGGVKTLRLSVSAIAYVDSCEGGAVIRLIGGESLRVNEDCATVELRACEEHLMTVEEIRSANGDRQEPLPVADEMQTVRRASARKGKRR